MAHVPSFGDMAVLYRTYKTANRYALENFLLSLDTSMSPAAHRANLLSDARLYGWGRSTIDAIAAGIRLAYDGRC